MISSHAYLVPQSHVKCCTVGNEILPFLLWKMTCTLTFHERLREDGEASALNSQIQCTIYCHVVYRRLSDLSQYDPDCSLTLGVTAVSHFTACKNIPKSYLPLTSLV